jgi:pyrroline-5-carboxylate reductase
MCFSPEATDGEISRARAIFEAVGKAWVVPEELMNAVTGLSGSGPAYIYMVIEALSDGGVKMGMPRQLALELAAQTVLGAAKLVQDTGQHPAVLRDQVTTPGGTTISAIHELERHGLRPMLISAVVTATKKSRLLARAAEKKHQR